MYAPQTGLVLLTVLPEACPDPFAGILIAVFIYAIGGGLIRSTDKSDARSLPH